MIEHSLPPQRLPVPKVGFIPKFGFWRLKDELVRYCFAKIPSKVITVSERAKIESLHHTFYRNITVCQNGIDVEAWFQDQDKGEEFRAKNSINSSLHLFGCVGNLFEIKSFHIAVLALSLLSREQKDQVALCVIGVGPEEENLRNLVETLNLDNVYFLGKQFDMLSAYSAMQTLLITSNSESAPLSLLEATACGCDVISSDVGNCTEVIGEMKNGEIIASREPEVWAAAIERYLDGYSCNADSSRLKNIDKFKLNYDIQKAMRKLVTAIMGEI